MLNPFWKGLRHAWLLTPKKTLINPPLWRKPFNLWLTFFQPYPLLQRCRILCISLFLPIALPIQLLDYYWTHQDWCQRRRRWHSLPNRENCSKKNPESFCQNSQFKFTSQYYIFQSISFDYYIKTILQLSYSKNGTNVAFPSSLPELTQYTKEWKIK